MNMRYNLLLYGLVAGMMGQGLTSNRSFPSKASQQFAKSKSEAEARLRANKRERKRNKK